MKRKHRKHHHIIRNAVMGLFAFGFVGGGIFALWIASFNIPDLGSLEQRRISQSTKIYDRTGEFLLYDVHEDIKRTIVPFDKINRHVKNATVAIEDTEFYQHNGVRPVAFFRAILANLGALSFSQGGSTITQQVVKNTILTKEKQISRKLKEWVLSIKLEQVMDKESILALYLNESPYGGNIYGIQEASQAFFGKNSDEVTLAEAAYLAALPNAPTFYSPYGNNRDRLEERKNLVLKRMFESNFINEGEFTSAKEESVVFKERPKTGITAPHFVLYVKEYLELKYGVQAVGDGGLKVITTLDYQLQQKAEEIVKRYAEANEKTFNAANAGLIAIDPKTGGILAMVGSRDYFSTEVVPENCSSGVNCAFDPNFNITLAKRQPGSAFKPFVYATALSKGYTPETVVFDLKTEFSTFCNPDGTPRNPTDIDKCYQPTNYDNIYRGPVTMRDALAQSINVPAIKFLYLAGLRDSLQVARDLGITSLEGPDRYGLTLVLGGGEVSLLEMVSAYGVFANAGIRNKYFAVQTVHDPSGKILEDYTRTPVSAINRTIALEISDMLSDNKARAPAFGETSFLNFPGREVAVKTGTTNDYKDAWIIGYTPSFVVGAWAGNNDNSSMEKKVAGFIIAPLWNEFMKEVFVLNPSIERFERAPEEDGNSLKPVMRGFWRGNLSYTIDKISGKLATEFTPPETREEKVVTEVHSILHWVDRNNPLGPTPLNPQSDSQYQYWEYSVRNWVVEKNIREETSLSIPTLFDDIHTVSTQPRISILGINQPSYYADTPLTVYISSQGIFPLSKVDFFLNDQFIGSSSQNPFLLTFTPNNLGYINEINSLKAIGYDSIFNKGETVVALRLQFR